MMHRAKRIVDLFSEGDIDYDRMMELTTGGLFAIRQEALMEAAELARRTIHEDFEGDNYPPDLPRTDLLEFYEALQEIILREYRQSRGIE